MKPFLLVALLAGASDPTCPYDTHPVLRPLMDAVTFHHSFDHESMLPDMAVGDWKWKPIEKPTLAPDGLRGKALLGGSGMLLFPDPKNWAIATRGAFAVWVCPVEWDHENAGLTTFVVSQGSAFYVERQGPKRRNNGLWGRREALLAGMQRGVKGNRGAKCSDWQDGEWHLVAVNWSWPELALSIDGKAFNATVFKHKPDPKLFSGFLLGSRRGDPTLIDEAFFFSRPLSASEVKALHDALKPKATKK